jgi:hypothetical protein
MQHDVAKEKGLMRTCNVLSLYRSGALRNSVQIMHEYGIDLLAIREVRVHIGKETLYNILLQLS